MSTTFSFAVLLSALVFAPRAGADVAVSLAASSDGPTPVGRGVVWTATGDDTSPGTLWYRFRIRYADGPFRVVRDYGPDNVLFWTPSEREGIYEIEVSVKNLNTGNRVETTAQHEVFSCVSDGDPAVSPTSHPLVWLYSAPPCPDGSRMRVRFQAGDRATDTPWKDCRSGLSMNFYLAGLLADTAYTARHVVDDGASAAEGPEVPFTTSSANVNLASYQVLKPHPAGGASGVLLQSNIFVPTVATDLDGNVLWYYPLNLSFLTRPIPGGTFLGMIQSPTQDASYQILREFDVVGDKLRETNAARISEQLIEMGKRPVTSFHHEAAPLPDGKILVLATTEQIMSDVQREGEINVLGDMILVLDRDLQVVWAWDAFDHLDAGRIANLGEICTPDGAGCPPFYLAPSANDWLHGNAVQLTPDGNLLYSIRHQDWVVKIDYRNGEGSGDIIWRLGGGGDFAIDSPDPAPWFSHQHDAVLLPGDESLLLVYDNGNVRYAADPGAHSRGQVLHLDEAGRVATLVRDFDLGGYSFALGSAQLLPNGNYHFNSGILPGQKAQSIELDPDGNIVYAIEVGTPEYRSFRMLNLYSP